MTFQVGDHVGVSPVGTEIGMNDELTGVVVDALRGVTIDGGDAIEVLWDQTGARIRHNEKLLRHLPDSLFVYNRTEFTK